MKTSQNIADIIKNKSGLYEGNLNHYFKMVFEKAKNLNNPYHNFRHIFHVVFLCHKALEFYFEEYGNNFITKDEGRALLIAAMFHDFDHPGKTGNDDLNINFAIRGIRNNILEDDKYLLDLITDMIRSTEYPVNPKYNREKISLIYQILCDTDISQALSVAWIQQIIFGLAVEMNMTPKKILEMQGVFIGGLKFYTEWANKEFTKEMIDEKIKEAAELLELLN
jgi:hypothetical protein